MAREKAPTDYDERAAWIMYQLRLKKSSFAKIARQYDVRAQTVRRAIYIKYPKWDHVIADTIGFTPAEIWPERYAA
jgi:lambda repressor-like predicted transcriptional regulator